jgi:type II restriction enzyme
MVLKMDRGPATGYTSGAQVTRRITETWASTNLYCAACDSERVDAQPCNTRASDFRCPSCSACYQLKARRSWSESRVPDAAYAAMIEAIRNNRTPNLVVLHYDAAWNVRNLLLIPSFFFNESAVERRPPLAQTARRAGWVGCNIRLDAIAPEGKLHIVRGGVAELPQVVRARYGIVRPLARLAPEVRGWALDVLRIVRRLATTTFTLSDVYAHEAELTDLHPSNRHVRDKIRQQLQVLRDADLIRFLGRGSYELT